MTPPKNRTDIGRDGAAHQEAHIHQGAEEGRDADQPAEQEARGPTNSSPATMTLENQTAELLSIKNWMKLRYQP